MERKTFAKYAVNLIWFIMILRVSCSSEDMETTTDTSVSEDTIDIERDDDSGGYAWSSWGSWSPCSKTCGGGVTLQIRQCVPNDERGHTNGPEGALTPPTISVRITREIGRNSECIGEARRYHECNKTPCSNGAKDGRAQQCAAYDRRPFKGRFYTWVPYIDGNSPCTLNCRPLGQLFYASLSLVADGTPCTKPGYRAICVQGVCKDAPPPGRPSGSSFRKDKLLDVLSLIIIFIW